MKLKSSYNVLTGESRQILVIPKESKTAISELRLLKWRLMLLIGKKVNTNPLLIGLIGWVAGLLPDD